MARSFAFWILMPLADCVVGNASSTTTRAPQLAAVKGSAQAEHLWDNRDDFLHEWKSYYLIVPDGSRVLHVFRWIRFLRRWHRYRVHPGYYCYYFSRLLRPRG